MRPTSGSTVCGGSSDLKLYIYDGASSLRFEIGGSVTGDGARRLAQSWKTASSTVGEREFVIDVGEIKTIDRFGLALFQRWHEIGARFIATSVRQDSIESIIGQPVEARIQEVEPEGPVATLRRYTFPLVRILALLTIVTPAVLSAASLSPSAQKAWEEHLSSLKNQIDQRAHDGKPFLWIDEDAARLKKVQAGEIVVSPVGAHCPKRVPNGTIHDWIGAIFIPNVTIKDVFNVVRDYSQFKELYRPTVAECRLLSGSDLKDRYTVRFVNKSTFMKSAIDADYETQYVRLDDKRVYSVARATRIQEIENYGTADQRFLSEGEGNGYVWRLFATTRYVERDGGVYIELEALGLSREIPAAIRWLAEPVVRRMAQASLMTSLRQTESALRAHVELTKRQNGSKLNTAMESRALVTHSSR